MLPVRCGGCDVSGVPWCPACERTLAAAPPARSWTPTPVPAGLPPVWTVLPYDGPTRAALVNWKDHGRRDLAQVLAGPLTEAVLAALVSHRVAPAHGSCTVVAVPTPSSRANVRRRGDRPLRTLSDHALSPLPINERPRVVDALRLRRPVEDQAGLDSRGRAANLAAAMVVPPDRLRQVAGACCLVVDDVITTGATLTEAARALSAAGAATVLAVTVAATRRSSPLSFGPEPG